MATIQTRDCVRSGVTDEMPLLDFESELTQLSRCHSWGDRISRASCVGSGARRTLRELEASTTQTCSEDLHGNTACLSKAHT